MSHRRHTLSLIVLGLVALAAFLGLNFRVQAPSGTIQGVITGLRPTEGQTGSKVLANVRLEDGTTIVLDIPDGTTCKVTDRVDVVKYSVLLGTRYQLGYASCLSQP